MLNSRAGWPNPQVPKPNHEEDVPTPACLLYSPRTPLSFPRTQLGQGKALSTSSALHKDPDSKATQSWNTCHVPIFIQSAQGTKKVPTQPPCKACHTSCSLHKPSLTLPTRHARSPELDAEL